jgi:hypothetical protein
MPLLHVAQHASGPLVLETLSVIKQLQPHSAFVLGYWHHLHRMMFPKRLLDGKSPERKLVGSLFDADKLARQTPHRCPLTNDLVPLAAWTLLTVSAESIGLWTENRLTLSYSLATAFRVAVEYTSTSSSSSSSRTGTIQATQQHGHDAPCTSKAIQQQHRSWCKGYSAPTCGASSSSCRPGWRQGLTNSAAGRD